MPRLIKRPDGTFFTYAAVPIDGKLQPRAFEIDHRGVAWLAEHGIKNDQQQMSRDQFFELVRRDYAYTTRKKSLSRVTTASRDMEKANITSSNIPKHVDARTRNPDADQIDRNTAVESQPPVPSHWQRRTTKKNWFG